MSKRDVNLIIRAKNDASRAFKQVGSAMSEMLNVQKAVAQHANEVRQAMNGTEAGVSALASTLSGKTNRASRQVVSAFELIETKVKSAQAAFDTQSRKLDDVSSEYDNLTAQVRGAAKAVEAAQKAVNQDQGNEKLKTRLDQAVQGYQALAREQQRAESAFKEQSAAVRELGSDVDALSRRYESAKVAMAAAERAAEQKAAASRNAASGMARLAEAERKVERASALMAARNTTALATINRVAGALFRLGPAGEQASRSLLATGRAAFNMRTALAAFYGDSRKALSLMQRLRGEVLSLTASFVGFYAVMNSGRSVFDAFAEMEAAENRLGAAFSQDARSVTAELGYLNNEASRLGISFDTLSDNYSKFLISARAANFTTIQTRTVFRQVSEASRVLKLNNEQITGVLTALTQIAGKGTLQMEELRQQLGDRLPGAVSIMARALGYSSDELAQFYKDVENGQIDAQRALVAFGAELERTYGGQLQESLSSVTAELGRFQNALFNRKLDAANSGFIQGVTEALQEMTQYLESDEGVQFFESLGAAAGNLAKIVPFLVENFDLISLAFKLWVSFKVGQVFAGLILNMRTAAGSARGFRVAMIGLDRAIVRAGRGSTRLGRTLVALRPAMIGVASTARAMWVAIGGPIGLIAAALGLFATEVISRLGTEFEGIDSVMREHERLVQRLQGAYALAATGARDWREELEKLSVSQINKNIDELQKRIDEARTSYSSGNGRDPLIQLLPQEFANVRLTRDPVQRAALENFKEVSRLMARGERTAEEYLAALRQIEQAFPELDGRARDFVIAEQTLAEAIIADTEAVERNEAMLRVRNGTATEADKVLLGLTETTEASVDPAEAAAESYGKFTAAMRELSRHIPELKDQMDRFDSIEKIERDFEAAVAAANQLATETERVAAAYEAAEARRRAFLALEDAQFESALSGSLVDRIIGVESGGNPTARNPESTATGLGQFIEGTWLSLFQKYFPERAAALGREEILALREDAAMSRQMVELYIRENGMALRAAGQAVNDTNLYLAHFLGPQGAINLLSSAPGTVANNVLGADQIDANQSILDGKTREEIIAWATRKVGVSENELAVAEQLAAADAARVARAREFHESQSRAIEDAQFELSIREQDLLDREVAKALREAELEAQRAGTELTAQQRADIEAITRERYAQQAADEARNDALEEAARREQEITRLQSERQNLIDRQSYLEETGDLTGAQQAGIEIEAVNEQLDDAISRAIAFWQALGGEGSEDALQRLRQLQEELGRVDQKAMVTGRDINLMIEKNASAAFSTLAQNIASGMRPLEALGEAMRSFASSMLIEIGKLIVKWAILRALGFNPDGSGGGGGIGGFIAQGIMGIFRHSGGLVGNGVGRTGAVPISAFANAVRYHTGGMAGLAADEYATILQKNEEVLTTGDPRHIFNQKGGKSGGGGRPKIINAFSYDEVVSEALNTAEGEEAFVNFVRKNASAVKAALEG